MGLKIPGPQGIEGSIPSLSTKELNKYFSESKGRSDPPLAENDRRMRASAAFDAAPDTIPSLSTKESLNN